MARPTRVLAALNSDNTWNEDLDVYTTISRDKVVNAVITATANGGYIAGYGESRSIGSDYINI